MMAFCAIEDQSASIEVVVFPNLYAKTHTLVSNEEIVILEAEVQKKENIVKLIAEKIVPVELASQEWTNGILISIDAGTATSQTLDQIKAIVERYPGDCVTCLKITLPLQDQEQPQPPVLVKLSDEYATGSDPHFFEEIEALIGESSIETRCAPVKEKKRKNKPWLKKKSGA